MKAKALKVYGGVRHIKGRQYRAIVATTSQRQARRITGVPYPAFIGYWAESDDCEECNAASIIPETMLIRPIDKKVDFVRFAA